MSKLSVTICAACLFLAAMCSAPARAEDAPLGMTMRIQQEQILDQQSATADYRAAFLPPDKFRVEGVKRIKAPDVAITIVGDGQIVRQINRAPDKTTAFILDLDRIRKDLPWADYAPEKSYDPSLYRALLQSDAEKKELPAEELDGEKIAGCEVTLPKGRLSLPFNVSMVFPDPAKARVWINPKDGLARKVELEDARGRTFLRTLYTEVKTGVPLKPGLFELDFPEGVKPVDITRIVREGVEATRRPPEPPQK